MTIFLYGFSILFILVTALPMLPVGWWWIRVLDYPRFQVAIALVIVCVCLLAFDQPKSGFTWALVVLAFAAFLYQMTRIWPFTPLAKRQVADAKTCDACVQLLVSNVRVGNRDAERLIRLAEEVKPDILLLVETNGWWDDALHPLASKYETVVRHPQENGYGLHFMTNMPVESVRLRFLLEPEVPSVHARLTMENGESILFLGIHPQPPVPNFKNTRPRDAELIIAGREASESSLPAIIAGDLNDVAWSRTTELLMRTTDMLDPRRGRGVFATFPVQTPGLRWPLDHIFHSKHFTIKKLHVCKNIGSDHFPVFVELCRERTAEERQESLDPEDGDGEEARQTAEEGKEEAAERSGTE